MGIILRIIFIKIHFIIILIFDSIMITLKSSYKWFNSGIFFCCSICFMWFHQALCTSSNVNSLCIRQIPTKALVIARDNILLVRNNTYFLFYIACTFCSFWCCVLFIASTANGTMNRIYRLLIPHISQGIS